MSEAEVTQLIQNILSENNQLRKDSEAALKTFTTQNPSSFISILLNLLKSSDSESIRSFCAIQLRKNLSAYSEKSFTNLWESLNAESQALVKQALFSALETEAKSNIRHQICDAIAEIGGSLIEDATQNRWPELIGLIWQLLGANRNELIESGLKILATLFTYASDSFKSNKSELQTIFASGMQSDSAPIQEASISALGAYIEVVEHKECKDFEQLIPQILATIIALLAKDEDLGESALSVLEDISEAEPKFFKKSFPAVFEFLYKVTFDKNLAETGVKKIAIEIAVNIGERIPSLYRNNNALLSQLIEMIFCHMIEIEEETTAEWQSPKEGFNDDVDEDSDLEAVRFGMNAIDRLISSVGNKDMLATLSKLVEQMFGQADWRYKHAAIMALSQVGEYLESVDDVKPTIELILQFTTNEHPKLRYAVCHCMGQIADDMQPNFQKAFHSNVLASLIALLDDPVPRVVSHAGAAITNFVEGMEITDLEPYLKGILTKAFALMQNGISIVKEGAISTVSALCEVAGDKFLPFFEEAITFQVKMIDSHIGAEYRQIRGMIIECLTLMAHAVGKTAFAPYASGVIELMIKIQESNLESVDPQKSYLLSGWQRLAIVLERDLAPYLPRIVPSLFKLLKIVLAQQTDDEKTTDIHTSDTEEGEIALSMLNVLIDQLQEDFGQFVEPTTHLVLPLVNYNTNENIRQTAAKCLPSLLACIKSKEPETAANIAKTFLGTLWNAANSEFASEIIIDQIHSMRDVVEEVGVKFMSAGEINEINEKIIKLLMDSDSRKNENEKFKQEEDIEKEEIELIDEDNSSEEDLHVAIAELIGALFKTHRELCLPLVDLLCNNVINKVLADNVSDKMHKFGIFLIDDMIEFLGIELIPDRWPQLSQQLLKFTTDPVCYVRQAAVYGVGILALKSKDIFGQMAGECVNKLYQALEIPQGNEKTKVYGHCYDNTVAALGKIIKSQSDKINLVEVVNVWVEKMPIKYDKEEAVIQHELLTDIVLLQPELILGESGKNIKKIISIFGDVVDTKRCTPDTKRKIIECLVKFKSEPVVSNNWEQITQDLTDLQKKKLESCMN